MNMFNLSSASSFAGFSLLIYKINPKVKQFHLGIYVFLLLMSSRAATASSIGLEADRRTTAYCGVSSAIAAKDSGAVALRYTVERAAA